MGGQSRYKVRMFNTNYRVTTEVPGEKLETVFGSDVLDEALKQYKIVAAGTMDRIVYLMQGTRIMRRSDRPD